jgi:simple sugar transport system permease protein
VRLDLAPRERPSTAIALLSPVIAIALTLVTGGLILAAMGQPPLEALRVYFLSPFDDAYGRAEVLVKAIPLALIGAGLAISFRANVWNIGAAGQYTLGAIAAGAVALYAPAEAGAWWLAPYLVAGLVGGALWAAIPALLRVSFNANEILVSLMLTYVAALLLDWLVRGPWKDPLGFGFPQTADWQEAFVMPILWSGTRLHLGIVTAVVIAVALAVRMARTLKGFAVRVIGAAPRAGRFAGFSERRTMWFVFLVSGALAGLAGAVEVSATVQQLQPDISAGDGFTAIIVAFIGRLNPVGALVGAFILAIS